MKMTGTWWIPLLIPNVAVLRKSCRLLHFWSLIFHDHSFAISRGQRVSSSITRFLRPVTIQHTNLHTCQQRPRPVDAESREILPTTKEQVCSAPSPASTRLPARGMRLLILPIPHPDPTLGTSLNCPPFISLPPPSPSRPLLILSLYSFSAIVTQDTTSGRRPNPLVRC